MSALRAAGAVLLLCSGWCVGAAFSARLTAHEAALRQTTELLRRIQQEIGGRRTELGSLYDQLCDEGLLPAQAGGTLQALCPPQQLTAQEAACFAECMRGLGHLNAEQECARLGYYIMRFEGFLSKAENKTQSQAALGRKLSLAAGAVLALLFV